MNIKDINVSRQYQQDIARSAEHHRIAAEARQPEEVVIEIAPGRTPFIFVTLARITRRITAHSAPAKPGASSTTADPQSV